MPKRKADELTQPQAKHACFHVPQWVLHEEHRIMDMNMMTTPPPDDSTSNSDSGEDIITQLESCQTALMRDFDWKSKRYEAIHQEKAPWRLHQDLLSLSQTVESLKQQMEAAKVKINAFEEKWVRGGESGDASAGGQQVSHQEGVFFAPHQYVPLPQS